MKTAGIIPHQQSWIRSNQNKQVMNTFMAGSVKGTTEDRNKANAIANTIAIVLITGFIIVLLVVVF
jgi:CHASE3 domain sensor protein